MSGQPDSGARSGGGGQPEVTVRLPRSSVAIVTGAGAGMGRATALAFAAAGARVAVADVDRGSAESTVEAIRAAGGEAAPHRTDVSDDEQVRALVRDTVSQWGRLDYAVNNAAIAPDVRGFVDADMAAFDRVLAVNLRSVMLCLKYELAQFVAQGTGGAIVNIGSVRSWRALGHSPGYTAVKHAVLGLTKSAALQHLHDGIRVNSVSPGVIDTPMGQAARAGRGETVEGVVERSGIPRMGEPEEVAAVNLWLCSSSASYVTGQDLVVDGGLLLR